MSLQEILDSLLTSPHRSPHHRQRHSKRATILARSPRRSIRACWKRFARAAWNALLAPGQALSGRQGGNLSWLRRRSRQDALLKLPVLQAIVQQPTPAFSTCSPQGAGPGPAGRVDGAGRTCPTCACSPTTGHAAGARPLGARAGQSRAHNPDMLHRGSAPPPQWVNLFQNSVTWSSRAPRYRGVSAAISRTS